MKLQVGVKVKMLSFDSAKVMASVDAATRRTLAQQGRYLQKVARSSIKKAPMERVNDDISTSGLSSEERQQYYIKRTIALREGRPVPKKVRRLRGSRPGTPPYSRTGLLRRFLRFGYDTTTKSAVIGPEAKGPKTADVLEYGGRIRIKSGARRRTIHVKPRPTMRLAYTKSKPRLTEFWRNSVKGEKNG